jgi:hypothetical protein
VKVRENYQVRIAHAMTEDKIPKELVVFTDNVQRKGERDVKLRQKTDYDHDYEQ